MPEPKLKWVKHGKYEVAIRGIGGWGDPKRPAEARGGGFLVAWDAKGIGFGELSVYTDSDGTLVAHTECMSNEFCEAVLMALARTWFADRG